MAVCGQSQRERGCSRFFFEDDLQENKLLIGEYLYVMIGIITNHSRQL